MTRKPFSITEARGFQLTFPSGHTLSVQFGSMNYHSERDMSFAGINKDRDGTVKHESTDAEVAVLGPDGHFVRPPDGFFPDAFGADDVAGFRSVLDVAALVNWCAAGCPGARESIFKEFK